VCTNRVVSTLATVTILVCGRVHAAFEIACLSARDVALCGAGLDAGVAAVGWPGDGGARIGAVRHESDSRDRASAHTGSSPRRRWTVRFSGGELFGLDETQSTSLELALWSDRSGVGLTLASLGCPLYRERTAGIGIARELGADTRAGLAVRALGISARAAGDVWVAAVDAALFRRVLGRVVIGGRFENIGRTSIRGSPVRSAASFGSVLHLDGVSLSLSVLREPGFDPSVAVGCEVFVSRWMVARLGGGTAPGRLGLGLCVGKKHSGSASGFPPPVVDVAWQWHPALGMSYVVSIGFGF
jgi:hypothetical protein